MKKVFDYALLSMFVLFILYEMCVVSGLLPSLLFK